MEMWKKSSKFPLFNADFRRFIFHKGNKNMCLLKFSNLEESIKAMSFL